MHVLIKNIWLYIQWVKKKVDFIMFHHMMYLVTQMSLLPVKFFAAF